MAAQPGRLRSVLRLAQSKEERALRSTANAARRTRDAGTAADELKRGLEELAVHEPTTAEDLHRQRQRSQLRAQGATAADQVLKEMLDEQLLAREELLGAIRRRRSLEELESRRLATQAGLAAHAAQRALDELATMRRRAIGADRHD